jgi:CBS domain-containing protein
MSPRAAWRLEAFGFGDVYDYLGGKADWLAAGLATEGPGAAASRAGSRADRSVPICHPDERVGDVARRTRAAGWDTCVVANDQRIVVGRLRPSVLEADTPATVEEAMEPGPTTIRADTPLNEIMTRLRDRNVADVLVTTPEGELIGLLRREAAT